MARRRPDVDTLLTAAGIVGPLIFIADWATLGATAAHYTPINEAISQLAKSGASTRPAMTAGFVVYGAGLVAFAAAARPQLPRAAKLLIGGTGLATFGLTVFSLNARGQGTTHAVFAGIGYATLALAPLVTAHAAARSSEGPRSTGERAWIAGSVAAGALCGAFLVASVFGPVHGLTQRIGLTAGDAWVMATAGRALWKRRDPA